MLPSRRAQMAHFEVLIFIRKDAVSNYGAEDRAKVFRLFERGVIAGAFRCTWCGWPAIPPR